MPEINLDDLQEDLINDSDITLSVVDAPLMDIDTAEEDHDDVNLYDLAPDLYNNPHPTTDSTEAVDTQHIEESDIIADLLRSKGIENPLELNYQNEEGDIEKVNFYELPYEEQLEILSSSDADIDYGLDEAEVEAISFLRENQVSLTETVEYFQRKAVEDYINSQSITGLEVDQYSNEELYVLHLKSEYPDLTDEEITLALEQQQTYPELFKKQVDKLRGDYKEIEQKQIEDARLEVTQAEEYKRKELEDTLVEVATNIKDIGGLTLDDEDRNEILDHILNKDMQGVSSFIKSLNSPERLFQLAWFAVKGPEAFDIIHDYYKKEIAQVSKNAFERGKLSVQNPTQATSTAKKSYTRKSTAQGLAPKPSSKDGMSINDITID